MLAENNTMSHQARANEELTLTALVSEAAGLRRSPVAFLWWRRSLTAAR